MLALQAKARGKVGKRVRAEVDDINIYMIKSKILSVFSFFFILVLQGCFFYQFPHLCKLGNNLMAMQVKLLSQCQAYNRPLVRGSSLNY